MIQIVPVSDSDELNDELQKIYFDSFPPDERREWKEMKELVHLNKFRLNQIFDDQALIGLISIWSLTNFLFIEHFAISESYRGKGIGSQILKQIIEEKSIRIVVEVEEPNNEYARRRIAFYERQGFSFGNEVYYQPPYSCNKNKVRMLLMSFPDKIPTLQFPDIRARLYREVYRCSD